MAARVLKGGHSPQQQAENPECVMSYQQAVSKLVRVAACAAASLFILCHVSNQAAGVTLAWDRNSATNLANYALKYGVSSGSYTGQVNVATNLTTATVSNLVQARTYYFVVTARNTSGLESDPSNEITFYVPGTATNAAPVAHAASVSVTEDTPRAITLTGSDANGDPITYATVAPPVHGVLGGTAPNLIYTPNANYAGADSFTFRVNDGRTNSATATVSITVNAVNDPPTLNPISNLTVPMSAGPQTVSLSGIGSGAVNENQVLSVTASSSNPSLIPSPPVSYISPNTVGSLTFRPAVGASGNVTLTVTVNDGQAQSNRFTRSFNVAVGTPPTHTLFLEAESGTRVAPMQTGSDPAASNGQYVYSQIANSGTVTFNLNVPMAGDYVVWCRNLSPNDSTDSFLVSVDGGTQDIYDTADNTWSANWQWSQLNGRTAGKPRVLTLASGSHELTFQAREAFTKLDSIYVTSDRNFVPQSIVPQAGPVVVGLAVSAADARSVTLVWATDRPARCAVEFGPTSLLGSTTPLEETPSTNHQASLAGLQPGTTYYLRVRSTDDLGNVALTAVAVAASSELNILAWAAEAGTLIQPTRLGTNANALDWRYVFSELNESGSASYPVQVSVPSQYRLWCRVWTPSAGFGSFRVSADGTGEDIFDAAETGWREGWRWVVVNARANAAPLTINPRPFNLGSGTHEFRFRTHEAGTLLDELILSNDPTWAPGIEPSPPVLSATVISSDRIDLTWTDTISDEDAFRIEWSGDGVQFTELALVPAGVTSHQHTGLTASTNHYRVYGLNESDRTDYSNLATATVGQVPAAPGALTATVIARVRVQLSWSDNSANESGFLVERSTDGISFIAIQTLAPQAVSTVDTPPSRGRFYYRVRAFNGWGSSAPSGVADARINK